MTDWAIESWRSAAASLTPRSPRLRHRIASCAKPSCWPSWTTSASSATSRMAVHPTAKSTGHGVARGRRPAPAPAAWRPLASRCRHPAVAHVDALNVAHRRGILHRDLKPSNLFLVDGEIEKGQDPDFGIARRLRTAQAMTQTGVLVGTPEYMAPEQARGQRELSPAVDIFALGCVPTSAWPASRRLPPITSRPSWCGSL